MSNINLKDEFKEWIDEQTKDGTNLYKEDTKKAYIKALSQACYEIQDLDLPNKDLFTIESLGQFEDAIKIIKSTPDFARVNMEFGKGSRQLSAGMGKYHQFLESRELKGKTAWFVGAIIGKKDQTQRFLGEGIWENGYDDKYNDLVNSIKVGDRIAIKSAYTRKLDLPFENNGHTVSVMGIKAIGTVTRNFNNGKKLAVQWEKLDTVKEWYFFTSRTTIWKVDEEDGWLRKNLIDFAFNDGIQDIDKFIKYPFWKERFGNSGDELYEWTEFYEALAEGLLQYKDDRSELISELYSILSKVNMQNILLERKSDGTEELLDDICPFTVFGLFNKKITNKNRVLIMEGLADFFEIEEEVPDSLEGIPLLNKHSAGLFGDEGNRNEKDIDYLWELFQAAINYADDCTEENKEAFKQAYDKVIQQNGVIYDITVGLFWVKPWDYLPLDNDTSKYLVNPLNINVPSSSLQERYTGEDYINLVELLKEKFEEDEYPVHSFPELSFKSWSGELEAKKDILINAEVYQKAEPYTKADFLSDVFMDEEAYETLSSLLKRKKNLILQGAPGVGKTYAAKRLAYSLMEEKDSNRVKMLQFHQSYAYEDFIMGYRPNETGFELKKGPFYEFCELASKDLETDYFFIIDEINRGNMSKVFGELLMLIESDKRGEELTLTYSNHPFSVPKNLYIIGMMNTADRSLGTIDYALRRRFCFFELEPAFESASFRDHLLAKNAPVDLIDKIKVKLNNINLKIIDDVNLGKGFRIGHSYFCDYNGSENWYEEIIKYEVEPLIKEYWFDEEDKADSYIKELLG